MLPRAARLPFPVAPTVLALLFAIACDDQRLPTGIPTARSPLYTIADASHDYKPGFYWLPPMAKQPAYTGIFDAALSPTVEICELLGDVCGPVVATYTTTTGPGEELVRLDVDGENYHVNWHTNEFDLSTTSLYRVSVRAGIADVLLGYADIQPVSNGSGLKKVDTDEYIGLVDGRTLPIKFRIETGIVGNVEVQPVEAEAAPGATQQFVAILRDLHGNLMSADVTWASSDENVATVDQTGLATAIADGVATITATSEQISGSATLIVVGGVVVISAGNSAHSCALAPTGKAYCWGLGTFGQLGTGLTANHSTPVAVAGNHTFRMIGAGNNHTCALTTAGKAYCWGRNDRGQLGDGTFNFTDRSEPNPVFGNLTFTTMSVGPDLTCAVTATGDGYCWGANSQGNICLNCVERNPHPVPMQTGRIWTSIVPGVFHTCGLTTSGEAWCWGLNTAGELGANSLSVRSSPLQVVGGHIFASLTVGQAHTCALTATNQAYCWGLNSSGALGAGFFSNPQRSPVPVAGGHSFIMVSAGRTHTCALNTDGAAYCWGIGSRLGRGSNTINQSSPVPVLGGLIFEWIDAGEHTCAVTPSHQGYCWGPGTSGQLGNGATANQLTPVAIAPLPDAP